MKMICFGDSNTYGYDPRSYFGGRYPARDRWVDILAGGTGWEVLNGGVNGREIHRGSDALRLLREQAPVDLFLVMLGTNDLLQGASPPEAADRMEAFLKPLLPHCNNILLVAPPPMKRGAWVPDDALVEASLQLAEEYQALARELSLPFADTRDWKIELTFDGVHFTEAGHHTFAGQLQRYLFQAPELTHKKSEPTA